jgi:nicotinic acid phosphoribosyltransferase
MFGVGTDMATSADAPALDIACKLTEYVGAPRMKLSTANARCLAQSRRFDNSIWRRRS